MITKGDLTEPYASVTLGYNKAAERVHLLVEGSDFLTSEELEKYEERLEARHLADMQEAHESMGQGEEQRADSLTDGTAEIELASSDTYRGDDDPGC